MLHNVLYSSVSNCITFSELILNEEQLHNLTLLDIEKLLQSSRRTLKDFPSLPYPQGYVLEQLGNRLIYDERNYNTDTLKVEFLELFSSLTSIYRLILRVVFLKCSICIFCYPKLTKLFMFFNR